MTIIDGCVLAVPTANRQTYTTFATQMAQLFKQHGALAVVEAWGVDVPDGKLTSFPMAVQLRDDESVVFSWIVWPSKDARDQAWAKIQDDESLNMTEMPFDGKRMIFGCFENVVTIEADQNGGFVDGFLLPCAEASKQAYVDFANKWGAIFQEFGALSMAENWSLEVPDGEVTSFPKAVKQEDGEGALFSWIIWPDKASRDAGMEKLMADPRMQNATEMPFDGKRMIFGGFEKIVDA